MTGYEHLRTAAAVVDLSSRGKLRVSGEDRARLLHAMSTNHVQDLAPWHGLYSFFLNDKGRILADAFIYNLSDSLLLDTEPETGAKLYAHLDRFIIADDVTLEDRTDSLACFGLEGPKSLELAGQLEIPVGADRLGVEEFRTGFTVRSAATGAEGVRIFVNPADRDELLQILAQAGVPLATSQEARVVRLENAVPRYGDDITERYLVQETQRTEGVHFNKGCYLGQEIVERVRSRGQVHRLLTPVRVLSQEAPVPGTKLSLDGKDIGELTSAAYSPALGEVVGFAYLRSEAVHENSAMLVNGFDPPVAAFVR